MNPHQRPLVKESIKKKQKIDAPKEPKQAKTVYRLCVCHG